MDQGYQSENSSSPGLIIDEEWTDTIGAQADQGRSEIEESDEQLYEVETIVDHSIGSDGLYRVSKKSRYWVFVDYFPNRKRYEFENPGQYCQIWAL